MTKHIYAIAGLAVLITTVGVSSTKFKSQPPPVQNVNVSNSSATPVPTKEVKTKTYVSISKLGTFEDGTTAGSSELYTVPSGKRLIITDMSGQCYLPLGEMPREIELRDTFGGGINYHSITMFHQATDGDQDIFTGTRDGASIAVEAGHVVSIYGMRTDVAEKGFLDGAIAGYLEDAN